MTTMVMFYWGGKIVKDRREGITYDMDASGCYDVERETSLAALREMIVPRMAGCTEHVNIKFICRYPYRRNGEILVYKKLPVNDDMTLQTVLNIPSRYSELHCVEIYVINEGSTMTTSVSRADVNWGDVQSYGELLTRGGDVSTLGTFTGMLTLGQTSQTIQGTDVSGQRMFNLFSPNEDYSEGRSNLQQYQDFHIPVAATPHPEYALGQWGCAEVGGPSASMDAVERLGDLDGIGRRVNEDVDIQSVESDEDVDVLMRNEGNIDSDDDGHDLVNNADLNDSPVPFFTNLDGVDDSITSRNLYDRGPTWSDANPEFAKGMIFRDKNAVISACNWYHVKKKQTLLCSRNKQKSMEYQVHPRLPVETACMFEEESYFL